MSRWTDRHWAYWNLGGTAWTAAAFGWDLARHSWGFAAVQAVCLLLFIYWSVQRIRRLSPTKFYILHIEEPE